MILAERNTFIYVLMKHVKVELKADLKAIAGR